MPRTDLPDHKPAPADKQRPKRPAERLDRRTAVAQARAIRREAAAKAETDKAHAAKTANTILEHAEPAPPKKPMHRQTEPVPVSNPTGKFDWLDDAKRSAKRADADELVEQLLQESKQRRRRRPARAQDPERLEQIMAETGSGKEQTVERCSPRRSRAARSRNLPRQKHRCA